MSLVWRKRGDSFALVAAVDFEIAVNSKNGVLGEAFAERNQAQVGKIGRAVGIAFSKGCYAFPRGCEIEVDFDHSGFDQREDVEDGSEVKGRFGENRFAGNEGFSDLPSQARRPVVKLVSTIEVGDEEAGVSEAGHDFENPRRVERFRGPSWTPANARKGRVACWRSRSRASRTRLPRERPLTRDCSSIHCARSSVRRRESVVLMRQQCSALARGSQWVIGGWRVMMNIEP